MTQWRITEWDTGHADADNGKRARVFDNFDTAAAWVRREIAARKPRKPHPKN